MSNSPAAFEPNTISCPSGDHQGPPAMRDPIEVSWTALPPSGSESQISQLPDLVEVKTTRWPSGDRRGCISNRVEEIASVGAVVAAAPADGTSNRHTFVSAKLRA